MNFLFRTSAASTCERCINTLDKKLEFPVHYFQRTSDILHLVGAEWVSKFKGDVSKVKSGKPGRRRKCKKTSLDPEKSPQSSKTRSLAQKKKRSLCQQASKIRQTSMEERSHTFSQKAKKTLKELLSTKREFKQPVNDTQTHSKEQDSESSGSTNKERDTVKTRTPQKKMPFSLRRCETHKMTGKEKEDHNLSKVTLQFFESMTCLFLQVLRGGWGPFLPLKGGAPPGKSVKLFPFLSHLNILDLRQKLSLDCHNYFKYLVCLTFNI